MGHKVYRAIIRAIRNREMAEPFTKLDFKRHCPGFGNGTYNAFLYKHSKDNPGGNSELFERVENSYTTIRYDDVYHQRVVLSVSVLYGNIAAFGLS